MESAKDDELLQLLESIKKKVLASVKPESKVRKEDVHTLFLNLKIEEIKKLHKEVDSFENPNKHFTKQYRILEGYCGKLQTDLDEIDGTGREMIRRSRKEALKEITIILEKLCLKAHENGIVCDECETSELT